jgi:hypothetical protein
VTEDKWWHHPGVMPLESGKVRATDSDCLRPNHNLARLGNRIGQTGVCHFSDPDELGDSHRRAPLDRTDLRDMIWTN